MITLGTHKLQKFLLLSHPVTPDFYRSVARRWVVTKITALLVRPFASLRIDNPAGSCDWQLPACVSRSRFISFCSLAPPGSSLRFFTRACRRNHLEHAHAPRVHRTAIISGFNVQLSVTCRLSPVGWARRCTRKGDRVSPRGGQFASRIGWGVNPSCTPALKDINNFIRLILPMYNGARAAQFAVKRSNARGLWKLSRLKINGIPRDSPTDRADRENSKMAGWTVLANDSDFKFIIIVVTLRPTIAYADLLCALSERPGSS